MSDLSIRQQGLFSTPGVDVRLPSANDLLDGTIPDGTFAHAVRRALEENFNASPTVFASSSGYDAAIIDDYAAGRALPRTNVEVEKLAGLLGLDPESLNIAWIAERLKAPRNTIIQAGAAEITPELSRADILLQAARMRRDSGNDSLEIYPEFINVVSAYRMARIAVYSGFNEGLAFATIADFVATLPNVVPPDIFEKTADLVFDDKANEAAQILYMGSLYYARRGDLPNAALLSAWAADALGQVPATDMDQLLLTGNDRMKLYISAMMLFRTVENSGMESPGPLVSPDAARRAIEDARKSFGKLLYPREFRRAGFDGVVKKARGGGSDPQISGGPKVRLKQPPADGRSRKSKAPVVLGGYMRTKAVPSGSALAGPVTSAALFGGLRTELSRVMTKPAPDIVFLPLVVPQPIKAK